MDTFEAPAAEADAFEARLLASLAHELRSPLNAVIGMSDALAAHLLGELAPRQQAYVLDILAAGRQLLGLIDQLLEVVRPDVESSGLEVDPCDLRAVLAASLALLGPWARQARVELGLEVDAAVPATLAVDRRWLHQVVARLVAAAIQRSPAGGQLTLAAAVRDGALEVVVNGMPTRLGPADEAALQPVRRLLERQGSSLRTTHEPGHAGQRLTFSLPLPVPTPHAS